MMTSPAFAGAMTKLVAADALTEVLDSLLMGNLVKRTYEPNAAALPRTNEGLENNGQCVEADFLIPDVTKVLAVPELLKLYMAPAVHACSRKIEIDLLEMHSQCSRHALSLEGVQAMLQTAEPHAEKFLIARPEKHGQLRELPDFVEFSTAKEAGLRTLVSGPVGKVGNIFIFRSQFLSELKTKLLVNIAFTRDAFALDLLRPLQPLPGTELISEYAEMGTFGMMITMHYQPETVAQKVTLSLRYGVRILRKEFAVEVFS